jgi:acyl carrier protein
MDKTQILSKLAFIIKAFFKDESIVVTNDLKAADVDKWDSLNHALLLAEIQEQFKVSFDFMEIESFETLGDIVNSIASKN